MTPVAALREEGEVPVVETGAHAEPVAAGVDRHGGNDDEVEPARGDGSSVHREVHAAAAEVVDDRQVDLAAAARCGRDERPRVEFAVHGPPIMAGYSPICAVRSTPPTAVRYCQNFLPPGVTVSRRP